MKILHITNDYSGSTVYMNLVSELDLLGLEQIVYNPIRIASLKGKNSVVFKTQNSKIIYAHILNKYSDRIFYRKKVTKSLRDIETKIDLHKIKIVHAHTWYSDGGVAYELHKKYGIPYIVTVRNTDLNLFFKYMLHLRQHGLNILRNAIKIVFISPVYLKRLLNHSKLANIKYETEAKSIVISNGIDSFWIVNVKKRKDKISAPVQLIYVGKFSKGKNVIRLLKAVSLLNKNGTKCHLHLVGGGGEDESRVLKIIKDSHHFSFHGKIIDKEALIKLFAASDIFTMPSHHETFGLVYIEAMSQGIPVVYTKNEGIFGLFDHTIGEAVDSKNVESIMKGISKIVLNYDNYSFNTSEIVENHNWNQIAQNYKLQYDIVSQSVV